MIRRHLMPLAGGPAGPAHRAGRRRAVRQGAAPCAEGGSRRSAVVRAGVLGRRGCGRRTGAPGGAPGGAGRAVRRNRRHRDGAAPAADRAGRAAEPDRSAPALATRTAC
ncbi:hypothetical protein ACFPN0_03325 [Kitasatospora cinereorecta]